MPSLPTFLHPQHPFTVHRLPAPVSGVDPAWSCSWGWWLLCAQRSTKERVSQLWRLTVTGSVPTFK